MDKTIKELYVSPELESLEMAMESFICGSEHEQAPGSSSPGGIDLGDF